jgi:hypothetical protein
MKLVSLCTKMKKNCFVFHNLLHPEYRGFIMDDPVQDRVFPTVFCC